MIALVLCALVFVAVYVVTRRSRAHGLGVVMAAGYAYGILRANLLQPSSHFIFDAALVGFYLSSLKRSLTPGEHDRSRTAKAWVVVLSLWPTLLLLAPLQDPFLALVGLRGHILLLPLIVFGARLSTDEWYTLALWYGGLNLLALAFALVEFSVGIALFYPVSEVTRTIYMSRDVAGYTAYRIPAIFTSAHAYGGTMVSSIPLLIGAWQPYRRARMHSAMLIGGLGAAVLGVFFAAARMHAVIFFLVILVALPSFMVRVGTLKSVGLMLVMIMAGWAITAQPRLQRFMSLQNTSFVEERIGNSVNASFLEAAERYPLGVGIGGGGTSVPYFLRDRIVKEPMLIENHYAYLLLELGVPGLAMWVLFMLWVAAPRRMPVNAQWWVALLSTRAMVLSFFLIALIGTGLLVSIPQSAMFLLAIGWLVAREPATSTTPPPRVLSTRKLPRGFSGTRGIDA